MTPIFVQTDSIKFFAEPEITDLHWELRVQTTGDSAEANAALHFNVPVQGCGIVHQMFPLTRADIEALRRWIDNNISKIPLDNHTNRISG